jgi:hypothetical protein
MKNFPFYKKTVFLGALLPLISYACFTPNERILVQDQQLKTQKKVDELTLKLVESIAAKLKCDQLEAMAVIQAVDREQPLDKREAAAYELAIMENRPTASTLVFEQFTWMIESRLDREKFDAKAFNAHYGTNFTDTWTMDHTLAIEDLHPALDAFIFGESNNQEIKDEPELSAGEHLPVSAPA